MNGASPANSNRVIFRGDASPAIGGGHIMRCMSLADALARRGMEVGFAVSAATLETVPALAEASYELILVNPEEPLTDALHEGGWGPGGFLVIDHYEIDALQVSACRRHFDHVVVIDDLARGPHDCDLLINQGARALGQLYAGNVPCHALVLAGPQYALLRPDFAKLRNWSMARRRDGKVERLFVSFGLTDVGGWALFSVLALAPKGIMIDVAVGSRASTAEALKTVADRHENVRLHFDAGNVAELMSKADLAIGAGGSTSWERCTLGVPTIVAVAAENQRAIAEDLHKTGAARLLEIQDAGLLSSLVDDLIHDAAAVRHMQECAASICDGAGAERVAEAMARLGPTNMSQVVTIRPSRAEDRADFWLIRNDSSARAASGNPAVVPWGDHVLWWQRALETRGREMFTAELAGHVIGYVRFDAEQDGVYATSIALAPQYQGCGLGGRILQAGLDEMTRRHPEASIIARIQETNIASVRIFQRVGFLEAGLEQGFRVLRYDRA